MICAAESAEALGQGGKFTVEWVATFAWNQWQFCRGMGGNFCVESVASLPWNRWQLCHGISGNFRVEYANDHACQAPLCLAATWIKELPVDIHEPRLTQLGLIHVSRMSCPFQE